MPMGHKVTPKQNYWSAGLTCGDIMIDSFHSNTGIYNGVPLPVPDNPLYPPLSLQTSRSRFVRYKSRAPECEVNCRY